MSDEPVQDNTEVKNLNQWLVGLVIFVTLWSLGIFIYVGQKVVTPDDSDAIPALVVDASSGNVMSNLLLNVLKTNSAISTNEITHYRHKDSYEKLDFVIIDKFFIEGLVIDKSRDNYTILYKDRSGSLQKIIVPKTLLLVPAASTWVNPYELKGE